VVAKGERGVTTSGLPYQYVVLRCVPRVDREEFVNVGVVVYCEEAGFLESAWSVDRERLVALSPRMRLWVRWPTNRPAPASASSRRPGARFFNPARCTAV
jgi:hypothetical protein